MKSKTYLRQAARKTGMDAGNLSRLAEIHQVPLTDQAALVELAGQHLRDPEVSSQRALLDQCERTIRRSAKHHKMIVRDGSSIMAGLIRELMEMRQRLLDGVPLDAAERAQFLDRQAEDMALIGLLHEKKNLTTK